MNANYHNGFLKTVENFILIGSKKKKSGECHFVNASKIHFDILEIQLRSREYAHRLKCQVCDIWAVAVFSQTPKKKVMEGGCKVNSRPTPTFMEAAAAHCQDVPGSN